MTDDRDGEDGILNELAEVLRRAEPIPEDATLAARSAIAWRRIDAELAELLQDTAAGLAAGAPATRSVHDVRTLTFAVREAAVEVEVHPDGPVVTLLGLITPPGAGTVTVRSAAGQLEVPTDPAGRFRAGPVARGPVSLRITLPERPPFETGWTSV